jgi:tetratricopeptide (TPR) repeat protein
MIDQPDVPVAAPDVPMTMPSLSIVGVKLPLSEQARASLESVRVAQEAARTRARRQTLYARIWLLMSMGAIALAVFNFGPRVVSRWRDPRVQAATLPAATPQAAAPQAAIAAQPSPVAAPPAAAVAAPTSAAPVEPARAPAPVAAAAEARAGARAGALDEECDTALIRSAPWRLSAAACARAFEAAPGDATLALAIAHAEHAHGTPAGAAQWAKRALALAPDAAEAHVILGRASMRMGQHEDARAAYTRYLELAPRGWHQTEARTALRRARATDSDR